MTVSRRLRFEILRRDGHTCRYCGAKAPDVPLTVDHVIPVALGGGDDPNNLVTACQPCNAGKSSIPADAALVEDVDATALLFAKAAERAAEKRREYADLSDNALRMWREQWETWKYKDGSTVELPTDWRQSLERFFDYGMDLTDLMRLIEPAMTHRGVQDEFRFYCHKVWQEITERQELARRMIEDGEV